MARFLATLLVSLVGIAACSDAIADVSPACEYDDTSCVNGQALSLLQLKMEMEEAKEEKKGGDGGGDDEGHSHGEERGWFACIGKKSAPPSAAAVANEIHTARVMKCTKPAPIKKLCCARWKKADFKKPGTLDLHADQSPAPINTKSLIQVGEDVVKICTVSVRPPDPRKGTAVEESVECTNEEFAGSEIEEGKGGVSFGELVLRERLLWYKQTGISMESVPKCAGLHVTCDDGSPPNVVDKDWVTKQQSDASEGGNLLMEEDRFAKESDKLQRGRRIGRRGGGANTGGGGGSLMTSGSFTMMASTGNQ